MKKWILAVAMAAMAVLNVQAGAHAKVQLWEGGPYWATTNIGADNPWDYGLYFWWGDIVGHTASSSFSFSPENTPTYNKSISTLRSEGWITESDVLAPAHDAAHVKWGGGWRMPTRQELDDLANKCDWTSTTKNGVKGYVVHGRGDYASASIFLPCAGLRYKGALYDTVSYGHCWSSNPNPDDYQACDLYFYSGYNETGRYYRYYGYSIRPVQGGAEEVFSVVYNANGGTGTIQTQSFESGKKQKLSKNIYHKDGYVFQGWAKDSVERAELATAGVIAVDYTDEQEITVDSDMTLYAVWANSPLTLTAESANWSSGSITLRCQDADQSGATHTYSLEYKNESGVWTNVNDVAATSIARSADGFAHLTDNTFWSRLGGIPSVEYRVKDENGRVSAGCVTRNRYGLFVGVGHYSAAYQAKLKLQLGRVLSDLPEIESNTRRYSSLAQSRGRFMITNLIETEAKVKMVDDAFVDIAGNIIPGDVCLFYASTHGDFNGSEAVLRFYDDDYSDSRLRANIDLLSAKNAAAICVLAACCSEAMVRQSTANVAVIAAANYKGSTTALFDEILWDYGWNDGWAGNGANVSFGELSDYVEARYNAIFNGITLDGPYGPETWNVQIDNFSLLSKIMAGTHGTHVSQSVPSAPNINATTNYRDRIEVSWDGDPDTDNYFIFYGGAGGGAYEDFIETNAISQNRFEIIFKTNDYECVEQSSENTPVPFMIRSFNGAGVSTSAAQGWIYIPLIAPIPPVPTIEWLNQYSTIATAANGDVATAASMMAANGCRTVGECYALGINPEEPNDDLKISHFEMKDGKPVITLNHTEDGSGNSFLPRVKTLGKTNLSDAEWREVPESGDPTMRFFKVSVEMP